MTLGLLGDIALLTLAYWGIDVLVRREALARVLGSATPALSVVVGLLLAVVLPWQSVPGAAAVRLVGAGLACLLAYKAATRDIDVVLGEAHAPARIAVVLAALASWLSPALLLPTVVLLTNPLSTWQHHGTLPMRVLQATLAYALLAPALDSPGAWVWFLLVMYVAHYLITALAKAWLGPRPWSWVTDNRLHHLTASAWAWGWLRFVPWARFRRFVALVAAFEVPLQAFAFTVEALSPLALSHPAAAQVLLGAFALFHVGVFLLSGLLFWEWVAADLLMLGALSLLGPLPEVFGGASVLAALVFLVALPLRHKLYTPMPLGWWDTPFTQRIHWQVQTASGAVYGLYNDFMAPHERIYGKVHGCFLAPATVCTYHLGEVWKHELRDALREAGPSLEKLEAVRERFGITPRSERMAEAHRTYLRSFFRALNGGARKHVLPRGLRWLAAPGGQTYHWGALPPYRRQEPVTAVTLHYRECYYADGELHVLTDVLVETLEVGEGPVVPVREPTPRELDDFLLGFAVGRLLDLPGMADGFVRTDDA